MSKRPRPTGCAAWRAPFLSEIEDKAWFHDRDGWRAYLDMLVAARFNRFNFALGFGYDFPKGVTGDYLHFPYPYLVDVPGYHVTITPPLKPGERKKNLETLKFIARETGARGLEFQLGLWTHAWAMDRQSAFRPCDRWLERREGPGGLEARRRL